MEEDCRQWDCGWPSTEEAGRGGHPWPWSSAHRSPTSSDRSRLSLKMLPGARYAPGGMFIHQVPGDSRATRTTLPGGLASLGYGVGVGAFSPGRGDGLRKPAPPAHGRRCRFRFPVCLGAPTHVGWRRAASPGTRCLFLRGGHGPARLPPPGAFSVQTLPHLWVEPCPFIQIQSHYANVHPTPPIYVSGMAILKGQS